MMRKITGKHLLCLVLLAFPLSWAEDMKKHVRQTENDTVWSQVKTRRLFARQKISPPQENHNPTRGSSGRLQEHCRSARRERRCNLTITSNNESYTRHKSNLMTPARRCGRLMEGCSAHVPCCDPCASCRCRLFNTICHCWRMNPLCLKKT